MRTKSIIYGLIMMAVVVAVAGCGQSGGGNAASKPFITCNMMLNVASQGCEGYKRARGTWPNSLAEVNSFMAALVYKDAWGREFVFTPYDAATGYGEITSYGRDGKPGGTGEDADIVIRFPVKANADWNRQQAASIKVPPGQADWYDSYLN